MLAGFIQLCQTDLGEQHVNTGKEAAKPPLTLTYIRIEFALGLWWACGEQCL